MKLDFTELLYALSYGLDCVEKELTGVKTEHGKRVACMSLFMARELNITGNELVEFIGCAILHDNAIAEYISEEFENDYEKAKCSVLKDHKRKNATKIHCVAGENNISLLPFRTNVKNIIRYHHGDLDGDDIAITDINYAKSQIIRISDTVDSLVDLTKINKASYFFIKIIVKFLSGKAFSKESAKLFLKSVTYERLCQMKKEGAEAVLRHEIPSEMEDYSDEEIRNIALTFAKIIDYKSSYTKDHSLGVAQKADKMAAFYNFDPENHIRFYFAAALHDVGKLVIPNDILEKPGKLSSEEFVQMKTHAYASYEILKKIPGLEDIAILAARHHEKLDGSGYPFGLKEKDLTFEQQLLACIDIYQALTERRPYKDGFSHEKTMGIMRDMVRDGQLNGKIVEDIDKNFGK